jgi:hypothetical protein
MSDLDERTITAAVLSSVRASPSARTVSVCRTAGDLRFVHDLRHVSSDEPFNALRVSAPNLVSDGAPSIWAFACVSASDDARSALQSRQRRGTTALWTATPPPV